MLVITCVTDIMGTSGDLSIDDTWWIILNDFFNCLWRNLVSVKSGKIKPDQPNKFDRSHDYGLQP